MTDTSTVERRNGFGASFGWLNVTQFLGALNDNIFKLLVVFCLIDLSGPAAASRIMALTGVCFVLPFLLFSCWSGVLADRYSKRTILVLAKLLEIAVMLLALVGFAGRNPDLLYGALFLMAAQSTLFSPSKYGIIPELVGRDKLSQANGLLTMLTYLAIILGSAAAPLVSQLAGTHYTAAQGVCVVIAVVGALASFGMRRTPPAGATRGFALLFVRDIWRTLWSIRADRHLLLAVLAAAYFMLLGAYVQFNIIPYGIEVFHFTPPQSGYLFLVAALGIAAGAVLAGRLSGRNIEFGIVPLGALALTAAVVALYLSPARLALVCPMIFLAGVGAGLFIVPVDAFIQFRAPPARLGEVLAAAGFLGWIGVLLASGLVYLNALFQLKAAQGFLLMGALTLGLTVLALKVLPDFFVRFVVLIVTRLLYRLRVVGREHVPVEGPALLVCNHVSYADALLMIATQQRRIRFIMARDIYERRPALKPWLRLMGTIPIAMDDSPKQLLASLKTARVALDEGFLVCIFAEGAITRTGFLHAFRRGFEHIVKGSTIPVVPVYIGGAWGSLYSYYRGQLVRRWPTFSRYAVTVLFGRPLPAATSSADLRQAVMELSCDYFNDRKSERPSLGEAFVRAARRQWRRPAISDSTGQALSFGRTLVAALALADVLARRSAGQDKIGLVLPPSVGGALANLAVTLLGKTPVNLNFTASAEAFRSAVRQCDLRLIVTARAVREKLTDVPWPEQGVVYLEDLIAAVTPAVKGRAFLRARLRPARAFTGRGFMADAVATILFSSGSTGEPKGVMLSHHNILSNIESLRMVFQAEPHDNVCAALPFFHSMGFTCTLWFPLLSGFSAVYHANPLDAAVIAELARTHRSTLLFATPTFLTLYWRKAKREDFASLRLIVVGAEKLKPRLAEAFEEKFGIRPLEGFGATELAPVAALSVPHAEWGGVRQEGWKEGAVGLPLPGVALRVVDPDTGRPVKTGEPGLLLVKGPNVMLGYWNRPDLTAEALRDGWYRTGDVARLDADGFVAITDRLSRFSKIGGEMVPHLAIEEALQKRLGKTEQVLAVTSVPDEKKGERLVVLFTPEAGGAEALQRALVESDLPNLWKPGRDSFFPIAALPVLGSGKLDLKAVKAHAHVFSAAEKT